MCTDNNFVSHNAVIYIVIYIVVNNKHVPVLKSTVKKLIASLKMSITLTIEYYINSNARLL